MVHLHGTVQNFPHSRFHVTDQVFFGHDNGNKNTNTDSNLTAMFQVNLG